MVIEILENAINLLSVGIGAMCYAIDYAVYEPTDKGKKTILFNSKIDRANRDPLIQLKFNIDKERTFAVSECGDYIDVNDLTANDLFEICNRLRLGSYQITDAE